jgi:ankyrin repeat protein
MNEMHDAAYHNDAERVAQLLAEGAAVDSRDSAGWTPLMWSVDMAQAWGEPLQVVRLLLAAGADPEATTGAGETVLMRACERHNLAIIDALLAAGANPNRGGDGSTPLHRATYEGFVAGIRRLLAAGADPQARDHRGRTAATVAAEGEDPEVIAALEAEPTAAP